MPRRVERAAGEGDQRAVGLEHDGLSGGVQRHERVVHPHPVQAAVPHPVGHGLRPLAAQHRHVGPARPVAGVLDEREVAADLDHAPLELGGGPEGAAAVLAHGQRTADREQVPVGHGGHLLDRGVARDAQP